MPSVEAMLTKSQLRWTGHVVRIEQERLPKAILYGELKQGKRGVGRPKLRFRDCIKRHLGNSITNWENVAQNRPLWRGLVSRTASAVDDRLKAQSTERSRKRANSSNINNIETPANPQLTCRHCGRLCKARIGLLSHEKACQRHTLQE